MYGKFDFLLIDTPKANLFTDALAISGALHAYLPVIAAKRWTPEQIHAWLDPMHKLSRNALGLAVIGGPGRQGRAHRKLDRAAGI